MSAAADSWRPRHAQLPCPACTQPLEFALPGAPTAVRCFHCKVAFDWPPPPPPPSPAASSASERNHSGGAEQQQNQRKRASTRPWGAKAGTDEAPASMEYYDLLEVPATATPDEIRKKYYRLAVKYHPDKNKDPGAEETFKNISKAYQVLSDPELRKKYNQYGEAGVAPDGGFVDPEEFFRQQFGGEKFFDLIGNIAIAQDFSTMIAKEEDEDPETLAKLSEAELIQRRADREIAARKAQEARDKLHRERVAMLAANLTRKLNVWVQSDGSADALAAFTEIQRIEANDLRQESYGVELLHAIGYTYAAKAQQHLGGDYLLGLPKFFERVREKSHIISETVSTIRTAVDLQRSFAELQQADKEGKLSAEEKVQLEQRATQQGLRALWKGSKLEVQAVLREVCDTVLEETGVPRDQLRKRAVALKIVGEAYQAVKADGSVAQQPQRPSA